MTPMPNAEVTLMSPQQHTAYSGMLPGWVAGHYRREECHIDLSALCGSSIRFCMTSARHADTMRKRVLSEDGSEHSYDLLSVDVGSASAIDDILGAGEMGIRVKPVDSFLQQVERLAERAARGEVGRIAVVGGGAAGVELCLALRHRIGQKQSSTEFHLVSSLNRALDGHNFIARTLIRTGLAQVRVHLNKHVTSIAGGRLHFRDGTALDAGVVIWATGAAAPSWLLPSGLALDPRGFILVDEHLRSVTHHEVFAAGDVASMQGRVYPKSGVYAVRQGPPLAENLRRTLQGQPLLRYSPQRRTLALISTGPRHAIASWGALAWSGAWVWDWKDAIDRRFMARYRLR